MSAARNPGRAAVARGRTARYPDAAMGTLLTVEDYRRAARRRLPRAIFDFAALDAEVTLTLLPARGIAGLAPWQFRLFRTLLFPMCRVEFRLLLDRVAEVNIRLGDLAAHTGATLVAPDPAWYGVDAIHVRRSRRVTAWRTILAGWDPPSEPLALVRHRGLAPAFRTLAGVPVRRSQPCAVLPDGTTISLY